MNRNREHWDLDDDEPRRASSASDKTHIVVYRSSAQGFAVFEYPRFSQ